MKSIGAPSYSIDAADQIGAARDDLIRAPLDALTAAQAFAALGSDARLEVIRVLVRAGPEGLAVGALRDRLDMPASTLSHHLKFLAQCGLLTQERDGRSLICRAAFDRIEALAAFLTRECCMERGAADQAADPCAAVQNDRKD